ncbi:spore germination protein [Paenibacillus gallinarum]|uniref:Spore germination protein n=1 Tax=Paenibacillus gallinarum TaxID=2762232 RepID=A0ABR8SZW0_9BACL|nr:spore germination protein [Paenibacillus gallinarum]MBD7969056.1 spore germination protein [Paenibacillus gallinarum]
MRRHHRGQFMKNLTQKPAKSADTPQAEQSALPLFQMSDSIQQMIDGIRIQNGNSSDIVVRELMIGGNPGVPIAVVYIESLVQADLVNNFIIRSLLDIEFKIDDMVKEENGASLPNDRFIQKVFSLGSVKYCEDWDDMIDKLLLGSTLVMIEGSPKVIQIVTTGGEFRSITESQTESVVRGPKEGFVESMNVNVSLLRRRIHSSELRVETRTVGSKSRTNLAVIYMSGIAEKEIVEEVHRRLDQIQIDAVFDSTYIEELIQDEAFTIFPTVYATERPDTSAVRLMEGRVIIIVDGSPFVLIVPTIFAHFFHSAADYSDRFDIAIFLRLLRYVSFLVLLLGPSLYIAMTTYHYQLIPSALLYNLVSQRENVPFPAVVEAIILELIFELLREAGVRMPRVVGQAANIVGGLVLGQAAVQAGIVSPLLTIVIAISGTASFAIPTYSMAIAGRLFRFGFILLAAAFGLYGIVLGLIALLAHMNSLRSFGIPYMTPFSPFVLDQQRDSILRFPFSLMKHHPRAVSGEYTTVSHAAKENKQEVQNDQNKKGS